MLFTKQNTMKRVAGVACAMFVSAGAVQAGFIESTFETSAEGWTFDPDGDVFTFVEWNPGGFIRLVEPSLGSADFFLAPSAYTGDKSSFIGGTLEFTLRSSGEANTGAARGVRIVGGGMTILHNLTPLPNTAWRDYEVLLVADGWADVFGSPISDTDFAAVMSDIEKLNINADWIIGSEQTDLGYVSMTVIPSPGALALLSVAGLCCVRRRGA